MESYCPKPDDVIPIVNLYKELAQVPTPTSAVILPGETQNNYIVSTSWSVQDVVKASRSTFVRQFAIENKDGDIKSTASMPPHDISTVSLDAYSPSGKKYAVVRKKKNSDEGQYLEIWDLTMKLHTYDVDERKEHGKICDDRMFRCFNWSSSEKFLLYSANQKRPKFENYFKDGVLEKAKTKSEPLEIDEFLYQESWGEALIDVHHTSLFIHEVGTTNVEKLIPGYDDMTVGQAIWGPNDESVVFIAWKETPRRLGHIYCVNRRNKLMSIDLATKTITPIHDAGTCIHHPRFDPQYETLIFFENEALGPHNGCSKILKWDLKTKQVVIVIDIVKCPLGDEFTGIFVDDVPKRCWSSDGKSLIVSSLWRSNKVMLNIHTENNTAEKVSMSGFKGSCSVLDIKDNIVIAAISSPSTRPCMILGHLDIEKNELIWKSLGLERSVEIPDLEWDVHCLQPRTINETYPKLDYDAIVIKPKQLQEKAPAIIWPHGGPHSAFTTSYDIYTAGFLRLGFVVCKVNYRGSIGFGSDSVDSLPGNIGAQDVDDVQYVAEHLLNSELGIGSFTLFGGSHGGFLAAHLSGQYPSFYHTCICRNPVIDLSVAAQVSDIPDWAWVESGQGSKFDYGSIATPEVLTKMWEKSSIKYFDKITVPTLILLGKNDLRVPPSQGLHYYHILKARGVPVKMFYYNDNHALSNVPVQSDAFVQVALWLKFYSQPEQS